MTLFVHLWKSFPPQVEDLGMEFYVLCSQAVGKVSITLKTLGLWMFKEEQEANRTRENWVARKGSRDEGSR